MSAGVESAAAQQHLGEDWVERHDPDLPAEVEAAIAFDDAEQPAERGGRPALAAFLILLAAAWLVACGLALYPILGEATLLSVVSWVATISVPLGLIALLWLMFGRTSRRETEKFTREVTAMRSEAQALDRVLALVAERLSANRTQLSDDAARLMKLGEEASDRLGRVTHYLSREADGLEVKSHALESAAAQARVDIGVLLADLPQAEQSARSFSDTLREAGVSAHERARALEAQLSAIAARAQEADVATGGAAERLGAHIARIQSSAGVAAGQLDEAATRLDAAVDGALGRTGEAVEATRSALDAQAQAMLASVEQSRARLADAGSEASRELAERVEEIRSLLDRQKQALFASVEESEARFASAGTQASRQLSERLAAARAAFDEQAEAMFATVERNREHFTTSGEEANRQMLARLQETRSTLDSQAEAMFAAVERSREHFQSAGEDANRQLMARLEAAQALVHSLAGGIEAQEQTAQRLVSALTDQIATLDERLTALGARAEGQSTQMATALAQLRDSTATLRQEVEASTQEAVALVGRANEMAGALDAVGARLGTELPATLADIENRAAAMRDTALSAIAPVQSLQAAAENGATQLAAAEDLVGRSRAALEALLANIDTGVVQVEERLREIAAAASQADDAASLLARETGPELVEALVRVREAARAAAGHAREAIAEVIPQSAASLAEAAQRALSESITGSVREQIGELEASSQRAAAAARKASERLTRQLLTLGEGAAALEAKLEEERAKRDEEDREAMPRRVALLMESLNSTAIDVTKILSNDVTDTAWQAYLKGDRGVFTRRAVRLLDSGEAREIQRHYDQEPEFREQVNRYIGDFENMLRRILADGDGNTLAVTILSSDMGKLYVALAQAIQHLRI
jgi:hypothetical protein